MKTEAPSCANRSAVASPMPAVAAVTSATLPSRRRHLTALLLVLGAEEAIAVAFSVFGELVEAAPSNCSGFDPTERKIWVPQAVVQW